LIFYNNAGILLVNHYKIILKVILPKSKYTYLWSVF